jgi:hypothetical protein
MIETEQLFSHFNCHQNKTNQKSLINNFYLLTKNKKSYEKIP